MPNTNLANISSIRFKEQSSTPSTPASTFSSIFLKSDGVYVVDDAGTVTGPLVDASGASASPLTTKGDLFTYSTVDARLAVGTNDQALIADSGETTGVKWGTLAIAGGGTGQVAKTAAFDALSPVTTKGDLVVRDASNNIRFPVGTNDYLMRPDSTQASGLEWVTVGTAIAGKLPSAEYTANEGSDYTETSTSFVAVDTTNFDLQIVTNSGKVQIGGIFTIRNSVATDRTYFNVYIDDGLGGGYVAIAADDGMCFTNNSATTGEDTVTLLWTHSPGAAGTYNYRLYWKVQGGTSTMSAGAGTSARDVHPQFAVREVA